jgi:uncharacterized membrane protein
VTGPPDEPPGAPEPAANPPATPAAAAVQRDVDRLAAFSDGVFAIAITLLVLSIDVPDLDEKDFTEVWGVMRSQLLSYALSFVVVGVYWKAHHRMFRSLRRVTGRLLNLNLLMLGFIALIPFPSDVLGNSGTTTGSVVMYSTVLAAAGFAATALWWYLMHEELVDPVPPEVQRATVIRAAIAPTVFLLSIPIAFGSPLVAQLFWLMIVVANIVVNRKYGAEPESQYGPESV